VCVCVAVLRLECQSQIVEFFRWKRMKLEELVYIMLFKPWELRSVAFAFVFIFIFSVFNS
jgi:hypothetical protein